MSHARYIVEREDAGTVVISDVGSGLSVTNDVSAVVRELHDSGVLRGRRLLYYDSFGKLDEIRHDGAGRFTGISPGPGSCPNLK